MGHQNQKISLSTFGIFFLVLAVNGGRLRFDGVHAYADSENDLESEEISGSGPIPNPVFTTEEKNLTLKWGSRLELECKGHNFHDYGNFWYHGSKLLSADGTKVTKDSRIHICSNNSLVINHVMVEDSGMYSCEVLSSTLKHYLTVEPLMEDTTTTAVTEQDVLNVDEDTTGVSQNEKSGCPHVMCSHLVLCWAVVLGTATASIFTGR